MTRKKGGGRESGEQGTVHLKPDVSKGGPKLSGAYGSSAANPAALSPEVRKSIEEAIEANRPLIERVGLEVLLRVLFKAYRVLESENRILTDAMRKEIAKVRALEAELADVRKWLNATHANQQDLVMERNDAVARAEKAEARVKERLNEAAMWDERREEEIKALQARVKELESGERFTETMFRKLEKAGWKFDELRGEDSG